MKNKNFRFLSYLMVVMLLISIFSFTSAGEIGILHNQEITTQTYGSTLALKVISDENNLTVNYRPINETEWVKLKMDKAKEKNSYNVQLPIEALTPPGVEYFFESNKSKTDIFRVATEYDPISGNPSEIMTVTNIGDVIGYDLQYHNGVLPNGKTVTWTAQSPTGSFSAISSKLEELRTTGSNPHQGIDVAINTQPVYAVASGKISFVNTTITNDAGMYIKIAHNADGTTPSTITGDLYSHYYHLSSIKTNPATGTAWKAGDVVSKGALIAVSGDTGGGITGHDYGYHLDFGFDIEQSGNRVPLPGKSFYATSSWNGGMDLDFAQPARAYASSTYGTILETYAYPKGSSNSPNLTLVLYMGADGTTPTNPITMMQDSTNPQRYYAYLAGNGFDNSYASCYIRIYREGLSGYVTRPIDKYAAVPSKFYRIYVNPSIGMYVSPVINQTDAKPETIDETNFIELTE